MTGAPGPEVRVLVDFRQADEIARWRSIDDGVMGGLSTSALTGADGDGALFHGTVSLERNGGFASVRRQPDTLDLAGVTGFRLRVRGDGRRYRLRLRTDDAFDGVAYQAAFETAPGSWQEVTLPLAAFEPTLRGRRPPAAPPLDARRVRQLGLMIADRQAGRFALEIAWIGVSR